MVSFTVTLMISPVTGPASTHSFTTNVGPSSSIVNDPASVSSSIILPAASVAQVTTSVAVPSVSPEISIVPYHVFVFVSYPLVSIPSTTLVTA